ncbi:MAG TPA: PAS domain-containing protein, partial [Bacilli bacterium]|nr:PAS domain-containing protein [Bacilli bacterium]
MKNTVSPTVSTELWLDHLDTCTLEQMRYYLTLTSIVFEQMREGVIITDEQGLIRYVNPAFTAAT